LKDLVVLCADRCILAAVEGILRRPQALQTRELDCKLLLHPAQDSGCATTGPDLLQSQVRLYQHALILMDWEFSGRAADRVSLERDLETRMSNSGWDDRAAAIVIEPEVEAWVWSTSLHVPASLGWKTEAGDIRTWLRSRGFQFDANEKPRRPKEAMHEVLRFVRKKPTSAIFAELAQEVSLERCSDAAFLKLRDLLRKWFPA